MSKRLAIVGSGAIACGLAATAAHHGPVLLLARSESSADRARATVEKTLRRLGAEVDPEHVQIVTDPQALTPATFVVEAVVEDHDVKARVLAELDAILDPARSSRARPPRCRSRSSRRRAGAQTGLFGLHVFNPVTKMKLVELIFPTAASADTRRRALTLCEDFEKTPSRSPTSPGSWSTACCSRICSARSAWWKRPA